MSGKPGTRLRAYTITDSGRRYLAMVAAGVEPQGADQRPETCQRGHVDWYVYPSGSRKCRACQRYRQRLCAQNGRAA